MTRNHFLTLSIYVPVVQLSRNLAEIFIKTIEDQKDLKFVDSLVPTYKNLSRKMRFSGSYLTTFLLVYFSDFYFKFITKVSKKKKQKTDKNRYEKNRKTENRFFVEKQLFSCIWKTDTRNPILSKILSTLLLTFRFKYFLHVEKHELF